MSLKVGVSGVRGIFGDSLTKESVENFAYAFGKFCKGKKILIGRDTRISGPAARMAVIKGLLKAGSKITDLGLASTPTMLFMTRKLKAAGSIIITASHNPIQWNGLKFVRPDGTFLTASEAKRLYAAYYRI